MHCHQIVNDLLLSLSVVSIWNIATAGPLLGSIFAVLLMLLGAQQNNGHVERVFDLILPWLMSALTALVVWILLQIVQIKIWKAESEAKLMMVETIDRRLDDITEWKARMIAYQERSEQRERDISTALTVIAQHGEEISRIRDWMGRVEGKIDGHFQIIALHEERVEKKLASIEARCIVNCKLDQDHT